MNWFAQHGAALRDALRQLFRPRSGFLMNVLVIAIALALPFAGLTVIDNVRPLADELAVDPEISVFLRLDTPREQAVNLATSLRKTVTDAGSKARLEFVAREKALDKLKDKTGMADVLGALGSNPLPDSYIVRLSGFADAKDAARVDDIAAAMQALPGVESVQVDSSWVKRLAALLGLLRTAMLLLAATLGVVVVAVVFNTIRLQVLNQREEIDVMRLVGATDVYICRPFFYAGALLGLAAGAVALGAVALALVPLNDAIAGFARLYASEFRLTPLPLLHSAVLLAFSAALGYLGARLSVGRHLARMA